MLYSGEFFRILVYKDCAIVKVKKTSKRNGENRMKLMKDTFVVEEETI